MKTDNIPLTYLTLNLIFFMFFSVWSHLKDRSKFLVINYLSWIYIFQDTADNHIDGYSSAFRNSV